MLIEFDDERETSTTIKLNGEMKTIPTKILLYSPVADDCDAITDGDGELVDALGNEHEYSPASTGDICTICGTTMNIWDNAILDLGDNDKYYCFNCIVFSKPPWPLCAQAFRH